MATLKLIGKNIAKFRKVKGFTQEDLAGAAEIDRSYLSEIENGHKNLSVTMLLKISEALDIDVNEFFE